MSRAIAGLMVVLALTAPREAAALLIGGTGNEPRPDPGWPAGAAAIFNHPGRVAWWEGPPFGGGQWHAECRGDAAALNAVLADFARLEAKVKRVVVHDGVGHSFWLAPNREPEKLAAAKVDWIFMVWQAANWERLHKLPADLDPTEPLDPSPPAQIDVFTAGIRWEDVRVPEGITVNDLRLSAHGYTTEDGVVIEGKITDLATGKPLAGAMKLQRIEPQEAGGYRYPVIAEAKADERGRWVLTHAPAAWVRVVVEAEGVVPRVVGHARFEDQPLWQSYDAALERPAPVSGRITDEDGQPLADVEVRLDNVVASSGGRYEAPDGYTAKTDAFGRFRIDRAPLGKATVWLTKAGYTRPGLGEDITTPMAGIEVTMKASASVRVTVDFGDKARPGGYMVKIEPEGGEAVGKYGGAGDIDAENRISFEGVPPGRYVLRGKPNPGSGTKEDESAPVAVDLKGGKVTEVTVRAK